MRFFLLIPAIFLMIGCSQAAHASPELPAPAKDIPIGKPGELRQLVLAGGCFWCTEGVFENVDGVTDKISPSKIVSARSFGSTL